MDGVSVIDAAAAHFAQLGRGSLLVPEWGCTVYWSPMTMADHAELHRQTKDRPSETLIRVLLMKLETAEGKPAFKPEDRITLLTKVDSDVISRVALAVMAPTEKSADLGK